MQELSLEMRQYDCPFIDTTIEHDVAFAATQWNFDQTTRRFETRMIVDGANRWALQEGLRTLRHHRNTETFELVTKRDGVAHIKTVIDETDAMGTIRGNDGYITGPFHIEDGAEVWHVGFDTAGNADDALSELDRNNEFELIERETVALPELQDLMSNAGAAMALVDGCRDLSAVERETLETAAAAGYFQTPREADLGDLAAQFDVSKPAVSKNLRRGQQKLFERVMDALETLER